MADREAVREGRAGRGRGRVTTTALNPQTVMDRLDAIDQDLAVRVNALEAAAASWYRVKRDREHARAVAFIASDGTVAERQAHADEQTALIGRNEEAEYEALRAVVRTLETRASIGQSLLRSYTRGA